MVKDRRRVWTLLDTMTWTISYFKDRDVDSPRLTAEILMCHCLAMDRLSLYLEYDRPLNPEELACYKALIKRRLQGEPVAYITGRKGFWDIEVSVSPRVLIPRPDTETLMETGLSAIKDLQEIQAHRPLKILELGSGSGALIISLARAEPGHQYVAVDVSPDAAATTLENARSLDCVPGVSVVSGSWFEPFSMDVRFDVVVSNPPYIPTRDIETLAPEIRHHEPRLALDGGHDGLDCIRHILSRAPEHLVPGGVLLFEMGFDQEPALRSLIKTLPAYEDFQSIKDEAGHHRVVRIKKRIDKKN
ncbi:peptide chain release factor N(5)-glutamine methyltransferase [Desulfocicer niacini]